MIGLGKHPTKLLSTHPAFYSLHNASGITFVSENKFAEHSQVVIGNDVWMGAGSLILGGINIGDGAVIAAGAIVTRDVEPYSVVGGIPAKLIRYRFPENIIEELMEWKWWNLPVDVLRKLAPDFSNDTSWTMEKIWKLKERAALFMN
jgi:carbonic anhydrase/acetyltransferase-like protein (isoleucine patch superfamily)